MCSIVISHPVGKRDLFELTIRGHTVVLPYDDMANLANLARAAVRDESTEKVYAYYDCRGEPHEVA